jgi:hypothetical protein
MIEIETSLSAELWPVFADANQLDAAPHAGPMPMR